MKQRTIPWLLALPLVLMGPAVGASSVEVDTVKPLVLVMLDTSGSMEYEAGDVNNPAIEYAVPLCGEPGGVRQATHVDGSPFVYEKSRLVVAKEILTGGIEDYWCEYDYRDSNPEAEDYLYPIPHVRACSGQVGEPCQPIQQGFDGVLDVFRDQMKFALMSFDSLEGSSKTPTGMWSYGDTTMFNVNLGIRNGATSFPSNQPSVWSKDFGIWVYADPEREADGLTNNRGQLVPASSTDGFWAMRETNRLVQYEIASTVGYWGTPLSPMVQDAVWFLENDPSVRPYEAFSGEGDAYAGCRERVAILVTDGRASQGESEYGYPSTYTSLQDLRDTPPVGTRVFVVGYQLADLTVKSAMLNLAEEVGGPAEQVLFADSPEGLGAALAEIFGAIQAQIQSRTTPAYTNATRNASDLQYQFSASFGADPIYSQRLVGYLDQLVYGCSSDCEGTTASGTMSCAQDLISLHDRLNGMDQDDRTLLTVIDDTIEALDEDLVGEAGSQQEMAVLFDTPQSGMLPTLKPTSIVMGVPMVPETSLGSASELAIQKAYQRDLIGLIRADDDSARSGRRLGAISHASPVVQEPARPGEHRIRSWDVYASSLELASGYTPTCRPTVLYTGTHDGLIHAFRVDHLITENALCAAVPLQDDDAVGLPLWSIAPHHLLKKAHQLVGQHHYLMDGQLHVADVLLRRGDPLTSDVAIESVSWRSVLTAGYGVGGRGYIALDVTDALDGPQLLWEIDHNRRCVRGDGCGFALADESNDFTKLGLTGARPAYGTAFVDGQEIAIAVLSAGDTVDSSTPDVGKAVYVVALEDGRRLVEFSNTEGNVVNTGGQVTNLTYAMTGSPSVYSNVPGVVSTRAYVGDAGGRLWRIDMSSSNTSDWRMILWHDPYAAGSPAAVTSDTDRQPVLGAPTLVLASASGELVTVYGTGSVDHVAQTPESRSVVSSVRETFSGVAMGSEVTWMQVLGENESLTGAPVVYGKVAYFTTYVANAFNACDPGVGKLYGVHYTQTDGTAPGTGDNTLAYLDADGEAATLDYVKSITLDNTVPHGVQVVERPGCLGDGLDASAASNGSFAPGEIELVINVANAKGGDASASTIPPSASSGTMTTKSVTQPVPTTGQTILPGAWGYVLY